MKTVTEPIRPIRNEDDLKAAYKRLEPIFHAHPGTPEGDESEVLSFLIHTYEREHCSWPPNDDPVAMVEAYLGNRELPQGFLVPYLGPEPVVSEVLERKRPLTVEMIRDLHRGLGIPLEDLIG